MLLVCLKIPKISAGVFQAAVRTGNIPEPSLLLTEGMKVPEHWGPGEFQGNKRAGAALCNFAEKCGKKTPFRAGFPVSVRFFRKCLKFPWRSISVGAARMAQWEEAPR